MKNFKIMLTVFIALFIIGCNGEDRTNKDISGDFDKICLEGHVYYYRQFGHNGYLAIKLDDYGNPVKCGIDRK